MPLTTVSPLHLTADAILTALSAGLSLFFAYFPGVKSWYDNRPPEIKPLIQLGLIAATILAYAFAACNFIPACVAANYIELGGVFLACLTANNMTYVHAVRQFKQKTPASTVAHPPTPAPVQAERP